MCRSNLANCKFTLVFLHRADHIEKYSKAPKRERDKLIVSSTMRGAAKNVIKIDVLLVEPVTIEAATLLTRYWPDRVDTMWRDCDCHAATRHCDCYCLLGSTCMSVHGLQDILCYGFKVFDYSSPTEAQLRLAPNMPCMTLVYIIICTCTCVGGYYYNVGVSSHDLTTAKS